MSGKDRGFPDDLVQIGNIVKAHGLKGEIKVFPYSHQPENFKSYNKITLVEKGSGLTRSYPVKSCRVQQKTVILQLEGVANIDDAEQLSGLQVWLDKSELPELGPDEYYWHDLEGMRVFAEQGRELGKVESVFNAGAHDILVVKGMGKELLIPVRKEIIVRIDDKKRTITISPIPGLLDLED